MADLIANGDGDYALRLHPRAAALLKMALARAQSLAGREEVFDFLTSSIEEALRELAGETAKEPTYAQVTYAIVVARDLSIPLPGEALRHRHAMQRFLSEFAPLHRRLPK